MPSNPWFLGPTCVSPLNDISIISAIFAQYISMTNTQTMLHATSVALGGATPYALSVCDVA